MKFMRTMQTAQKILLDEQTAWRDKAITRAYVTNETISLQWYLNSLFDPVQARIYIQTREPVGIVGGIEGTEPTLYAVGGIESTEPATYVTNWLPNEDPVLGRYSFGVFVPSDLSTKQDAIKGVVMQYKLAGKSFIIILF
jgi:hypothetical protein